MSESSTELPRQSSGHPVWRGRWLVVAAAILWSTSGFFAKAPIFESWPVESRGLLLAFWRALFATIILATMVRRVEWSWRLVPMVATFAAMNWAYLNGLVYCEATLAIWLQYTAPAWVFLMSWVFFRVRPQWRDWVLLVFVAIGLTIILASELGGASPIGVGYGLLSGLFFAGVVVTIRWLKEYDAAWLVFLNHAVTAVLFAPVLLHEGIYPSGWQWLYLIGFGVFQLGLPYLLFARALRSVSSHEASGLSLLEPLLVPVWVYVAWHHTADYSYPAISTLMGGGLILAGLAIRYMSPGSLKPNSLKSGSRS